MWATAYFVGDIFSAIGTQFCNPIHIFTKNRLTLQIAFGLNHATHVAGGADLRGDLFGMKLRRTI
jgi:hypothetical protein